MITLKCSLNKSIISCDVKQPYMVPVGSINKNMLSVDLQGELDNKVNKDGNKVLSDNNFTNADKEAIDYLRYGYAGNNGIYPASIMSESVNSTTYSGAFYNVGQVLDMVNGTDFSGIQHSGGDSAVSLQDELDKKVDKVTGKGLSANDYTDTEKAEVAKIKDKVGFTDYATDTKAGVVKVPKAYGLTMNPTGFIQINPATNDEIRKKTDSYKPIVPSTLDVAVRSVNPPSNMSYNVSTCTALKNTINLWALTSSITSMNLTLPSGIVGDFIQVDFNTLDTAPAFTITVPSGIIADYDFSPEPNTIYSLFFDWGVIDISKGMNNLTFGWRFGYAEYKYTPTEG